MEVDIKERFQRELVKLVLGKHNSSMNLSQMNEGSFLGTSRHREHSMDNMPQGSPRVQFTLGGHLSVNDQLYDPNADKEIN